MGFAMSAEVYWEQKKAAAARVSNNISNWFSF